MRDHIIRAFVTLLDVDPPIWRRIELPADFTLKGLHDVLQTIMGWHGSHLHHFEIGGLLYGEPLPHDGFDDREIVSERTLKLARLLGEEDRAFEYVYDYGDNWRCAIVLEALAPTASGIIYPRLVEGARHGPPEDIGGPWGYDEFLKAIADPAHEQHVELSEWSGGDFDPDRLDLASINAALAALTMRKATPRKKTKPKPGNNPD